MKIYTIGYERASLQDIIRLLKEHHIDAVIDVRHRAHSAMAEFSKKRLREALNTVGIEYRHCYQLGTPKHWREELTETGDWETFIARVRERLESFDYIYHQIFRDFQEESICLFCYERNPHRCHRSIVAEIFTRRFECEVQHLYAVNEPAYPGNWNEIAEAARKRADYRCQRCGKRSYRHDVHHIDGNIENNDASNLMALCRKCHRQVHAEQKRKTEGVERKQIKQEDLPLKCDDPIRGLIGLGKEIWEGVDPDEYIEELREGWDDEED